MQLGCHGGLLAYLAGQMQHVALVSGRTIEGLVYGVDPHAGQGRQVLARVRDRGTCSDDPERVGLTLGARQSRRHCQPPEQVSEIAAEYAIKDVCLVDYHERESAQEAAMSGSR
jgi:hypothetical protein